MKKLLYLLVLLVPGIHSVLAQVPPTPVAVQPVFISSSGFEVKWHQPATEGPAVDSHYLDVATSGSFTTFLPGLQGLEINVYGNYGNTSYDLGYTVANLAPGTTCAWRVRSYNSAGYSDYSPTQFITTKAQATLTSPGDWYHTYATEFEDYITAMASDDNETVYFTGAFGNTLNIGTFSLNSVGEDDIFFAAIDSDGEVLNAFSVGSPTEDGPGYLKVYGDFAYSAFWVDGVGTDVDPGLAVVTAGPGFVLAKYNILDGTLTWAKTFGTLMDGYTMAVGPEGIILSGAFEDVVDFDPSPGLNQRSANGGDDGFIASYTLDGALEWVDVVSGAGSEFLNEVIVDATNIYVTGHTDYNEEADVNPGSGEEYVGPETGFLLKLNAATGGFVWVHETSTPDGSYLSSGAVVLDMGSTILVGGGFQGFADFGNGIEGQSYVTNAVNSSYSGYLVEIEKTSGAAIGLRVMPGGYDSYISIHQMQKAGSSILVSGNFEGSLDFNFGLGGGERTTRGPEQYAEARFIASYSVSTRLLEWVKTFQFDTEGIGDAMVVNADGLYAAGGFDGSADLNPPAGNMVAMGNQDMYIVKYNLTAPPAAPAAPVASAATSVTGSGFTASWSAVAGAAYYRVDVTDAGDFFGFEDMVPGYAGVIVQSATQLVVTGLNPITEYKYRVRAITADGASANSNVITVSTGPAGPPAPSNFASGIVSNGGFIVTWNGVPDVTDYELELSNDGFETILPGYDYDISDGPYLYWYWNLVGLEPSTEYQVRLRAVDGTGTSVNAELTVTTQANPASVSSNVWVDSFGGSGDEYIIGTTSDYEGNVYVTGKTSALALTIGSFTLNPIGARDMFIAKYNSSGVVQWAKRIGGTLDDEGWHIYADGSGIYVSGAFSGTVDFDPDAGETSLTANGNTPNPNYNYLDDGFIAKYSLTDGSLYWAKSLGNSWVSAISGKAIYSDAGTVFITGKFSGTNDFDPNGGTWNLTSAGINDVYLGSYDKWTGAINWALSFGGTLDDTGVSITGDNSNFLYLAGKHGGTIDLNPGAGVQTVTGRGSFVSKFLKNGTFQWAKSYQAPDQGNGEYLDVTDIALDNDNIYAVGTFYGTADFDPNGGTYQLVSYTNSGFGTKLTKQGVHVWSGNTYSYGGDGLYPKQVIADAAGIYVVGVSVWSVDFDPGPGQANRASLSGDVFIARYNGADGGYQWAKTFGSWSYENARSPATLTNDGLYVVGALLNTINFDPYTGSAIRTSNGGADAFIARYESTSPPPPPAPVMLTPAFVSNTGAMAEWNGVSDVTDYRIDISADNFSTFWAHDTPMFGTPEGVSKYAASILPPNTTYKMRIRSAAPGVLRSDYSNVVSFTTNANPVPAAPNLWTSTFGSTNADEVSGIATDASGNVYTTGYYYGDITLGSTTLTHAGFGDVFFAKYNSAGTVQWAKSLSSAKEERGISVAVDATGVYIIGHYWWDAGLDFDPDAGVQSINPEGVVYQAFMAKYDLDDGSFIWAKPLNDTWNPTGEPITADGTSVYITGGFIGTNDFDTGAGVVTRTAIGNDDVYVARYSASDGSLVWVTNFGSADDDLGYSVMIDGAFVYASGYLIGTGDIDPGAGTNIISGAYFSKFNISDGSVVWTKNAPGAMFAFDLAKDASGLLVAGGFIGSVDMDPGPGVEILEGHNNGQAGYVGRYTLADGEYISGHVIKASDSFNPRRIIADNTGYYIGGNAAWGMDFDPGIGEENRLAFFTDAILARYTTAGELVWAKNIGSYSNDLIRGGLAVGSDGLYAAGSFAGTVNFDPYINEVNGISNGSIDGFLAKYQIEASAPLAPTATAATDVTSSGFKANWTEQATAANYRIDVSTSNSFANFLPGYENLTVSGLSKGLSGLEPSTTYYYQLRAVNDGGTSPNSNMITVTTAAATITAPVANAGSTISAAAFLASWNSVASATEYQLDVSADDFVSYIPGYQNKPVIVTSDGVLGLNASSEYKYRVRAVGLGGTSINSNVITVTTATFAPFAPVAIAANLITTTDFSANWNAAGGATGYKLDVSADNFVTFVAGYNAKTVGATSDAVTGLTPGKSYQYRVRATNAGGASVNSNVIVAVTALPPPPAPVASAASSVTVSSFDANWNAVAGATSYRLDVSGDNFVNFIAGYSDKTVSATSDAVTGLTPSTNYKYRVRAVDANGTSINSNVIDVATLDLPDAPVASAASSVTGNSFVANWSSVAGATSYRLDVSGDNFVNYIAGYNDKTIASTSDVVTALNTATAYKYRVRAVDANGTSVNSNVIDVTTLAIPAAPTATAANPVTATSFTANWNAVAGATSYRLDVSADNFSTYLTGFNNRAVSGLSESVGALSPETAYKYRVRAVNANGTSGNSAEITVTTFALPAPSAFSASNLSATGFTASWSTVAGATSYLLYVSQDNFATHVIGYNGAGVAGTSVAITGLTANTSYSYKVRATSSSSTSVDSNVVPVTTPVPPPSAPTASAATNVGPTGFMANWNGVAGATSYELDVSTDGFATFVSGYQAKPLNIIFESVPAGSSTTYQYRVRAVNAGGSSPNSNTISLTTPPPAPDAPVASAATAVTQTGFTASWNSVSGATGYRLDVSADNFSTLLAGYNNKPTGATSEIVTGLQAATPYQYRVRAENATGASSNSNEVSVTTLPKQNQTITFTAIDAMTMGVTTSFTVSPTSNSGLDVILSTTSDEITIAGNTVTIVKAGKATITASQPGDGSFHPATSVSREFCINPAKPTITLTGAFTETVVLTSSSATGNQWFNTDVAIGGATSQTLSVTSAGIYQVQVTVETCQSEMSSDTPVIVTGDIGSLNNFSLVIAPNPAEDRLLIRLPGTGRKEVVIYHITGAVTESFASERDEEEVSVKSYAQGQYLVRVRTSEGSHFGKFIKK